MKKLTVTIEAVRKVRGAVSQLPGASTLDAILSNEKKQAARQLIGCRIRHLRISQGITQSELAGMTGLKFQNISRIERGQYSTGLDILATIAAALNKQIDFVDIS